MKPERMNREQIRAVLNYEIAQSCMALVPFLTVPLFVRTFNVYEPYFAACAASSVIATVGLIADRYTTEKVVRNKNLPGSDVIESNPLMPEQPTLEDIEDWRHLALDASTLVMKIIIPPIGIACGVAGLQGAKGNLEMNKILNEMHSKE